MRLQGRSRAKGGFKLGFGIEGFCLRWRGRSRRGSRILNQVDRFDLVTVIGQSHKPPLINQIGDSFAPEAVAFLEDIDIAREDNALFAAVVLRLNRGRLNLTRRIVDLHIPPAP